MTRFFFPFILFCSFCFGQDHGHLLRYSDFYKQDIETFRKFMSIEPAVSRSPLGIQQMVYELEDHNVGIEEHHTNDGRIGEIYVFQTTENPQHAFSRWKKHIDLMEKDNSLTFVKGIFEDSSRKIDNLGSQELMSLLGSGHSDGHVSYGMRFRKDDVFHSLFVIKGNLVFTVDEKNY